MARISTADGPTITPATDLTTNIGIRSRERVVADHSYSERARQEFKHRSQLLRACLSNDDFLSNKGIGNEIGFHTFCYDPALEFEARALFDTLSRDAEAEKLPCTLKIVNLYDAVLAILEKRRVLKTIPRQEERRGTQRVLEDVAKFCSPEKIAAYILEQTKPHAPGDVILLTGAGEVYPFFRIHTLLDCMQVDFSDLPVVAAYPGSFNGSSFQLFNRLPADNYYRAIDIS